MQSHATALIIEHEHRLQLHASVQATLYAVRRRYWSVDCRSQVCSVIKKDEITTLHSRWSDCGPFLLNEKRHYNRKQIKTYIAVFVCFAIKVVHLELISDFFIEAFIVACQRFISRHTICGHLYSNNATNFIWTNHEFQELQDLLRSENHRKKVAEFLAERSIQWHFIPQRTPHFKGIWEAAVKSFKHHLKQVTSAVTFIYENFYIASLK